MKKQFYKLKKNKKISKVLKYTNSNNLNNLEDKKFIIKYYFFFSKAIITNIINNSISF